MGKKYTHSGKTAVYDLALTEPSGNMFSSAGNAVKVINRAINIPAPEIMPSSETPL